MSKKHHHKKGGLKTLVLRPLKKAMMLGLDKANISYEDDLNDIIYKFYKTYVKREQMEGISYFTIPQEFVDTIVPAILGFFKSLHDKKQSGASMSDAENSIYNAGQQASDLYAHAKDEEIKNSIGDFLVSNWLIILAVAVAIYLITRKK
jgi:hypothetical protein